MGWLWDLLAHPRKAESVAGEVLFSARRSPREASLSFWTNASLYEDMRNFSGGCDMSSLLRASLRLGLGMFGECPELVRRFDTRGAQRHHVTVWVDESMAGRVVLVSKGQQSRFIRASVEVGLIVFRAHPELIPTLNGGREE